MHLPPPRPFLLALLLSVPAALAVMPEARAGGRDAPRLTPKERARVELGRRLFFDPTVSRSGARACVSCHDPEHGYSDRAARSRDDVGLTRRHSQTLLDAALNPTAHWDGEFESLESLITARLRPPSNGKGLASHGASLSDVGSAAAEHAPEPARETPSNPAPREKDEEQDYGSEDGANARGPAEPAPAQAPSSGGEPSQAAPAAPDNPDAEGAPKPPPAPSAPAENPATAPAAQSLPEPEVTARPEDPQIRLDVRRLPRVDAALEHAARYREAFLAAYGSPDVNVDRLAGALAAYCRTLSSGTSPYDRHVAGEADALTAEQRHGLALFNGRARCAQCHVTTPSPDGRALFTDFAFHDTGIAFRALALEPMAQTRTALIAEADRGREKISTRPQDRRAFKTPSLRDVARRGPYFHDGSAQTLEEVVRWYAEGGSTDPHQDPRVRPMDLSHEEIGALVAFLRALTGAERPGLAAESWKARATRTRLEFVDGLGRPLAGWSVRLEPAGDVLPGWTAENDAPRTLLTDARGTIAYDVPPRTHVRIVLPDALPTIGGDLVPDTCGSARIEVPVDGRVPLTLITPAERVLPDVLAAEHVGVMRLPGHPAPRTLFTRVGTVRAPDGKSLTLYTGWWRTDVPSAARLLVPGDKGKPVQRLPVELARTPMPLQVPTR